MSLKTLEKTGKTPATRSDAPVGWLFDWHRDFDRMFEDFMGGLPSMFHRGMPMMTPSMNLAETEKTYEVTIDLPGMDEKDVEITLKDGVLMVKGEKKVEHEEKDKTFHVVERSFGAFSRAIRVPEAVEEDKIAARFEKGVLTISLPRAPEVAKEVRKIEVKGT
jgi:HSP20 family protein